MQVLQHQQAFNGKSQRQIFGIKLQHCCKEKMTEFHGLCQLEKLLKTLLVIQDQMDTLPVFIKWADKRRDQQLLCMAFPKLHMAVCMLQWCNYQHARENFDITKKMCGDALDIYKKHLLPESFGERWVHKVIFQILQRLVQVCSMHWSKTLEIWKGGRKRPTLFLVILLGREFWGRI